MRPIEEFFSLVLPTRGTRVLVEMKGDAVKNYIYDEGTDVSEIADDALAMDAAGSTVYMALGGFERETVARFKGRTADNARWFKSFWFDIDVGESKDYKTIKEAASELTKFVNDTGVPAPTVVHSGHGLHVYWPLNAELSREQWSPAAVAFKALADARGLKLDTTCTQDAARILRPIDTHNYKHGGRVAVRLIQTAGSVPFTTMKQYLASLLLPVAPVLPPLPKIKGFDFGLGAIDQAKPEDFSAKKIIAGCQQFQWAAVHQADVQEPIWRAMIGTLYRTDDPASIHPFSNKHPNYTQGETEAKATAWAGGGVTCHTLEQMRPGGCNGCPKHSVIKSPSWFGIKAPVPLPPAITDPATGMPDQWFCKDNAIYMRSDDGPQLIYNGTITFGQPYKDKDPVSKNDILYLPLVATTPMDQYRMDFHMGTHASLQEMRKALSTVGIVPEPRAEKEFYNGMRAWIQRITEEATSVKPVMQLGWQSHEAGDTAAGFVLGTTLYTPGATSEVRVDPRADKQARHMKQAGTLVEWKEAINVYNRPAYSRYALMSWLAFGAPLARLLGQGMPIAHFNSQGSGHGKTGTQDLLLSAAGNPRDPNGRWTGNATILSIYAYLTAMNGNIAILDETSAIPPEVLSKLMFEATLGSGRKAMQGVSGQTRDLPPISGMLCTSGNMSLQQLAQTMKGNSEAQVARVFEFNVQRPPLDADERFADAATFRKVYENYGHAMPIFIRYVVDNQVKVRAQMLEIENKLIKQLGMENEERFWRALLVVCITGALVAKKLGLIDHDVQRLIPAAMDHFLYQRAALQEEAANSHAMYQFIQDNQTSILVVDSATPVVTAQGLHLVTASRQPPAHINIRMRYVLDTGRLFVDRKYLRAYCSERNIDFRQLLQTAYKEGWLVGDTERHDLTAYTRAGNPGRVVCCVFNMHKAKAVVELLKGK